LFGKRFGEQIWVQVIHQTNMCVCVHQLPSTNLSLFIGAAEAML
jgi:hypothetical protein